MAKITATIEHRSGIPLGGIGTGTVEIRPDGYFHEWQMFNLGPWAPQQPKEQSVRQPELSEGALAFYLRVRGEGEDARVRRLGLRSDQHNPYSFAYVRSPEQIVFNGRFPVAELEYVDSTVPVKVTAAAFSPMVPHDAKTSGTPGFYMAFRVRNTGSTRVEVALAGTLANAIAQGADDRKLLNELTRDGESSTITMRTKRDDKLPTNGSMSLRISGGGEHSWVLGEYAPFMSHCWRSSQAYAPTSESILHGFRGTGGLPSLSGADDPTALLLSRPADEYIKLDEGEADTLLRTLMLYPSVKSAWDRVWAADEARLGSLEGKREFLKDVRQALNGFVGADGKKRCWGDVALATKLTLSPGEEREIVFVVSWYFPYHFSAAGPVLGHMYENWFADSLEVAKFMARTYADTREKVMRFAETLYETSLPEAYPDAWAGQLSTLNKCTWWCKDGKFAVWEGLGCCGFHTTDITYQGSFNLLALWPELQKSQMTMGAGFQNTEGFVHHMFWPDLSAVDEQFDRVDMNQQFVLLVARDYLWTGDRGYLEKLWANIVMAMESTAKLDRNGDGLPDHNTRRNTYDCWDLQGTPSYIASLWISALLAAIRLAQDLGKTEQAEGWRAVLKTATASFEKLLWNGEYYSLWVDGPKRDECCMTDQIDGEWFTNLIGLGHVLPRERIVATLKAIYKHNFTPEQGLINASYPPGRKIGSIATYNNAQGVATWTGIEYAIASMMIDFGMVEEGAAVVRSIHDRYLNEGRFWNQMECGDHYYRAMASWAVLLAVSGFKLDVPRGVLTIAPPMSEGTLTMPWFAPEGYGMFTAKPDKLEITCRSGSLTFEKLKFNRAVKVKAVTLNSKTGQLDAKAEEPASILLKKPMTLKAGDTLVFDHH